MANPKFIFVRDALLRWFHLNGRDLPWRKINDPYRILISEIMLQQTQVDRVIPAYTSFIQQFPDFGALARATIADVIRSWRGLGYNRRAVYLHRTARIVVECHGGRMPSDISLMRKLPGVGEYTSSAVSCFAYNVQVPVIDINVERVLTRVFSCWGNVSKKDLGTIALSILPNGKAWEWNQGLMDFGALICTARAPTCNSCVLATTCAAFQTTKGLPGENCEGAKIERKVRNNPTRYEHSRRYYRGMIVRHLVDLEQGTKVPVERLARLCQKETQAQDLDWIKGLLLDLSKEGIVTLEEQSGQIMVYLAET